MKIVLYYPRAITGDGGMTNAVRTLAKGLADHGQRVTVTYDGPSVETASDGVEWRPVRHVGGRRLKVPVGLEQVVAGADVVVMHSAWVLHNAVAGAVARRHDVPYVLAPRGAYDPRIVSRKRALKKGWWQLLEKRLVDHAAGVHVFFDSERKHLEALGYRGVVVVAPNGVQTPPGVVWDGGSGGYVLWMGRFDPEHKGLDLLIRAVGLLAPEERPVVRLHGPDWRGRKPHVERLVTECGLQEWITIGPPVYEEDKWSLLRRARGFVYPSRWEGFGNSAAEAAAVGVPLLTTRYPLGCYLAERGAGFVADSTVEALAAGLRELCSADAARVAQKAVALMGEEFSWEAVSRSWCEQLLSIEAEPR